MDDGAFSWLERLTTLICTACVRAQLLVCWSSSVSQQHDANDMAKHNRSQHLMPQAWYNQSQNMLNV